MSTSNDRQGTQSRDEGSLAGSIVGGVLIVVLFLLASGALWQASL